MSLLLVSRFRITHEFGYVAINIFYTYPQDEGLYVCRATNELGEDETSARLICRSLPQIKFSLPSLEGGTVEEKVGVVMTALQGRSVYNDTLSSLASHCSLSQCHHSAILASLCHLAVQLYIITGG